MPKDSAARVLLVAVCLCVVCSVVVSSVSVGLREQQEANSLVDKKRNILVAAGMIERGESADVETLFQSIDAQVIELATGKASKELDPVTFDAKAAAKDPEQNLEIPLEQDLAGIKRRAKHAVVYTKRDDNGELETVILPFFGKGLWSTMYGFAALEKDLETVKGLVFYEHAETPGLGGEVDNPRWLAQWPGKKLFEPTTGSYRFDVLKGAVNLDSPDATHQADGLSGATITTRGIDGALDYWFGENGFGPYLDRLRQKETTDG